MLSPIGVLWRCDRSSFRAVLIRGKNVGVLMLLIHQSLIKNLLTPRRLKYPGYVGFSGLQTKPSPAARGLPSYNDWQGLAGGSESNEEPCLQENGEG